MIRSVLRAGGLVLFGIVLAALVGEAIARWAFDPPDLTNVAEPDPDLGWRNGPNRSGWYSESNWKFDGKPRVWVQVNPQGLLDREYPFEKPRGVHRILVLGDSFTGDLGVPLNALFIKVAEARANQGNRWGRQEVINAGVAGFGTAQELVMFRRLGSRYEPDVVVLYFAMSDIEDNVDRYNPRPRLVLKDGRARVEPPPPSPPAGQQVASSSSARFLRTHVRLYRLATETLTKISTMRRLLTRLHLLSPVIVSADERMRDGLAPFFKHETARTHAAWEVTRALIRQLRDDVESHGARLAVVVVPIEGQVYPERFPALWGQYLSGEEYDLDKPNRMLGEFLTAEKIPFLDLLPVMRARAGEADLYRPRDGHWAVRGHAVAGTALIEFLAREGLMENRAAGRDAR